MRNRRKWAQGELITRSWPPAAPVDKNHRMVVLADELDWPEIERRVQAVRLRRLKSRRGRRPHLRALIGCLMVMSLRRVSYRELEDLVRHYAPARYLCGLTETTWTPDFTTIQDFAKLLGDEGVRIINEYVVQTAVSEKMADPMRMVADTTAQEAAMSWPNEVGLISTFMTAVAAATRGAGNLFHDIGQRVLAAVATAKKHVRGYRLFAKSKTSRLRVLGKLVSVTRRVQKWVGNALGKAQGAAGRVRKHAKVAAAKMVALHGTMKRLLPQICYWLRTGHVAAGKIINIHIPELYSIVRGKVGKDVEFGLKWGLSRIGGGFLLGRVACTRAQMNDSDYVVKAVDDHVALFGKPPRIYGYDRGGYSKDNVQTVARRGVTHVGIAPTGKAPWAVSAKLRKAIVNERATIEGCIGTIKSYKYGFNRPAARSAAAIAACGQRSILGFNLNKIAKSWCARRCEA